MNCANKIETRFFCIELRLLNLTMLPAVAAIEDEKWESERNREIKIERIANDESERKT